MSTVACPQCVDGTAPGPNGTFLRCHNCQGTGRVSAGEGDGMDVLRHWIARAPSGDRVARVLDTAEKADHYRDIGWDVTGPFVPEPPVGAVEEVERLRRVVCTCGAYEINFGEGCPFAHRAACPAVPPTPRGQ